MAELQYLQDKYLLDNDQMYRYEEKYKNDKDGTLQEYPSEPIDAFISSGRPFYDLHIIRDYPIKAGVVDDFDKELVWYKKEKDHNCVIGIDFAE